MLSAFAILLIVVLGAVIIAALAWIIHLNLRARRLGLPSPTLLAYFRPPSSNPVYQSGGATRSNRSGSTSKPGFLSGIFGKKKSGRGEFTHLGGAGGGGGGGGDDNDGGVWDSRGYYEEDAELGLRVDDRSRRGRDGGGGRADFADADDSPPRGRSRSRSPRVDQGSSSGGAGIVKKKPIGGNGGAANPFSDSHQVRKSTDTGRSSVFHEEAL